MKLLETLQHLSADLLKNASDLDFEYSEDKYQKLCKESSELQRRISAHYETTKHCNMMLEENHTTLPYDNILRRITSTCVHKTWSYQNQVLQSIRYKLETARRNHFLTKSRISKRVGNFSEAIAHAEFILKSDPQNELAHSLLRSCCRSDSSRLSRGKVRYIQRLYSCEYIRSFSHSDLQRPFSLTALEDGTILCVSDPTSNKVYRFTHMGEYLGFTDHGFNNPLGLIRESETCFWVCDSNNSRLVSIDSRGHETAAVNFKTTQNADPFNQPVLGCIKDDFFYLIIGSKEGGRKCLGVLQRNSPEMIREIVPQEKGQRFTGIANWQQWILFTEYFSPDISMIPAEGGTPVVFSSEWTCSKMTRLATLGRWLFVAAQRYVLKYDMIYRSLVYVFHPKEILPNPFEIIEGICASPHLNTGYLFVSTYSEFDHQSRIHIYSV